MKNVSTLKSNNTNSPKTPGGISKSLLTPCRRVGLSRNWRKSGPSPFVSPLSGVNDEVKEDKITLKKRKEPPHEENIELSPNVSNDVNSCDDIEKTPSRNVEVPRRKKSKILLTAINNSQEDTSSNLENLSENLPNNETSQNTQSDIVNQITKHTEVVSTPVRTKSKKSKKRSPSLKSSSKKAEISSKSESEECKLSTPIVELKTTEEATYQIKEKSPNDLRKECIVVIQKKIFKNIENKDNTINNTKEEKPTIETVDSDSDETPLITLQKQNSTKSKTKVEDDDDFVDNKTSKQKSNKVKDTKSPKNKHKERKKEETKPTKIIIDKPAKDQKPLPQSCFDDDDDDFDNKKTILIKKTYNKVSRPLKAKSTGSITQRDIDNLRNRIEAKKKLLLAQSLTPETEELRSLIKKWQKGCQDALMELLDLMRNKFPDKESMDYSEMLKTLKIPPSLVGYDSENDCFNSPDDASIVLGQFKDL